MVNVDGAASSELAPAALATGAAPNDAAMAVAAAANMLVGAAPIDKWALVWVAAVAAVGGASGDAEVFDVYIELAIELACEGLDEMGPWRGGYQSWSK